jgi:hypothetical protein
MIDPIAALGRSEAARTGWEDLRRPLDGADAPARFRLRPEPPEATTSLRPPRDPDYNRDTKMRDLLEAGLKAAKPICVGC